MYESGALNPNDNKGTLLANKLYEQIRKRRTDAINVAKNSGLSIEQCTVIKDYVFNNRHILLNGYKRFDPDLSMAQSWLRLSQKNCKLLYKHDSIMLLHELTEITYLLTHTEASQSEAHRYAESKYNYSLACREYYSKLGIKL